MNNQQLTIREDKTIFGILLAVIGSSIITTLFTLFFTIIITTSFAFFGGYSGDVLTNKVSNFINNNYIDYFITIVSMLCLIFVYAIILGKERVKSILSNFKEKKIWFFSLIAGLIFVLTSGLYSFLTSLITNNITNSNQQEVVSLIDANYYLAFVYVVILAPIVEEIGMRYFVFGGIKSYNKKVAYFLGSGLFAILHFVVLIGQPNINVISELLAFPTYFGAGLLLCYCYDKTQKLACPIIIHTFNNLISFLLIVL